MAAKKNTKGPRLVTIPDSDNGAPVDESGTPWGGRFEGVVDDFMLEFGASLPFDRMLWCEDIEGSLAHATMLAEVGILTEEELAAIRGGLADIAQSIQDGSFIWDIADEDIHMAIEAELTRRIGEAGKKLHTARSRNDQVACDLRLWAREAAAHLISLLEGIESILGAKATELGDAILPGYTHMQKAQPVLLATHLEAYAEMFKRDRWRMLTALEEANVNVLGSGALAGTTWPIEPETVADILEFDGVVANTIDGVSDRDFVLDLLYACAVCQMHMSRLCEELIYWSTEEFGFVTFSDRYSTGSSIMPQKKNPDFAELIRGKTGRVYGNLMALLTIMKGLPLAYNKDMQEDKEPLFDSVTTVGNSLVALIGIVDTLTFHVDVMREAAEGGFMAATDLADYLVGKGMAFRDAHAVIGKLVLDCEKAGKKLTDLTAEEYHAVCDLFEPDVLGIIDPDTMVKRRQK